jgi:hypothetical protein
MKTEFCKIIDFEDTQFLMVKNYNSDVDENGEDVHELEISFSHEGVRVKPSLGFASTKSLDEAFERFNDRGNARDLIESLKGKLFK